jgi:hypothetical protein
MVVTAAGRDDDAGCVPAHAVVMVVMMMVVLDKLDIVLR